MKKARQPSASDILSRIGRALQEQDTLTLQTVLEECMPRLRRFARVPATTNGREKLMAVLTSAFDYLARVYANSPENEGADEKFRTLEVQVTTLADTLNWPDMLQRLACTWGEIALSRSDLAAAERYFQQAAVGGSQAWIAGRALLNLAAIWLDREPSKAAYFYQWAAETARIPALEYLYLYCLLVELNDRQVILAEIERLQAVQPKTVKTFIQLAAANQALGNRDTAHELWSKAIDLMPSIPWYPNSGIWEAWIEHASSLNCSSLFHLLRDKASSAGKQDKGDRVCDEPGT